DAPAIRFTPDWRVLGYALALALVACVCFGLAPAIHGTRQKPSRVRLRAVLLAAQLAITVVLLTGAVLLSEGVGRAHGRDLGFRVSGTSTVSFQFPPLGYDSARLRSFFADLERKTDPANIAFTATEPLAEVRTGAMFRLPLQSRDEERRVDCQEVSGGYFEVL